MSDDMKRFLRGVEHDADISVSTEDGWQVVDVRNETGEGRMLFTSVLPGVYFTYNDFDMAGCTTDFAAPEGRYLGINHCSAGRIEQRMPGGVFSYISTGDLKISDFANHAGIYVFPTEHYRGVTFNFDIEICEDSLPRLLDGFPGSPRMLREKFCRKHPPYVLHDFQPAERLLASLYGTKPAFLRPYAQIKALELLLLLADVDYSEGSQHIDYFESVRVEKVKRARDIMIADLSVAHTVRELAQEVGLSLTGFKDCFKGVYGMPPYGYLKSCRMERASELLLSGDLPIADIAGIVGYDSPSKFTAAFKESMGLTPNAYRLHEGKRG